MHQPNFRSPAAGFQQAQAAWRLFERSPLALLILSTDLRIVDANDAYLRAVGRKRDTIADMPLFDAFPDNPHDPKPTGVRNLSASLHRVLLSGSFDAMPFLRYDIQPETGPWEVRYWHPKNWPILDDNGSIVALVHNAVDVTQSVFELNPALRPRATPTDHSCSGHDARTAHRMVAARVQNDQSLAGARAEALFNSELIALSRQLVAQSLDLLDQTQVAKPLSCGPHSARQGDGPSTLRQLLETRFSVGEVTMLTECYETILGELGLTSRTDPMTEIVAEHVMAVAQSGERDPVRLRERVLASFES